MKTWTFVTAIAISIASCGQASESDSGSSPVPPAESNIPATAKRIIIDVRTPEEWNGDGHAPCSINVPLDELDKRIAEFKSYESVSVVCRTGSRADYAKELMESSGIKNVQNLGSWRNVACDAP